ncbi:ATP-binding response regulator [Motilimonas pumila]|uniref:Hybrid sensor histidine kinase/response regulator n=1 Tax=Motilimonas pumila TaxID=2303987 RepID=A0A418Y9V3_9GAMM|nr:response regulator [Motilimonas pumila]RJG38293.1 hybrid sensor histidine kinase/response regulator [Motilimonas pumila]
MELSKVNVLIVDDMDAIRKISTEQLKRFGVGNVIQAENGAKALHVLKSRPIDMILSDWNMPTMTGIELLQEVRANSDWSHIPFIMITAEAERSKVAEAVRCGVTDLIIKPFTSATLQERVTAAARGEVRRRVNSIDQTASESTKSNINKVNRDEKACILVVDDTPDNLTLMAGLLKHDYQLKLARSGEAALNICQSDSPPDLVLLDIMMPGMNGFQVLEHLRQHPQSETIPVVFVTTLTELNHQTQGLRQGAVDYITKPVNPDLLKLRIKNFMQVIKLQKNLQADIDEMIAMAKLKQDVEQMLNHDLKGPLSGIAAIAQSMATDPSLSKTMLQNVNLLDDMSMQLVNMVNLSAEMYKIESGQYQLTPESFSIHQVLGQIVQVLKKSFQHKKQVIFIDPSEEESQRPLNVYADPNLTYSMLFNLLKNACEAAPSRSRVSVSISVGQSVTIDIQNIGSVPQQIRSTFWDKYVTSGKKTGTGLGTYSAMQLSRAQKLELSLVCNDEKDTTTIRLMMPVPPHQADVERH